ncbi:hypothetical protein [Chryseobacterium elymi]|uniref:hypothetical protein n=1 Tax=Chryseobacterium elymi TaxID=395936 RepID=UPI00130080A6|nr:hypothetical protein [Chryseobacterium elymi]
MKNLKNLKGIQKLNRKDLKEIIGGRKNGGLVCCEWCNDGSCNGWNSGSGPCALAVAC